MPGYPASHGCIRLTYAFAPKFFQMSSVGDNVITSRGRPKPTLIEHGALFQPLPPPTLPMVERQTSISPLERVSTPLPAVAAASASPVILAKAEMPTTLDSEVHPNVEEKSAPEPAAQATETSAKDADAEAASTTAAAEDNAPETELDPYRVHAITPDMSKLQERLVAPVQATAVTPDPAPAATPSRLRTSPPTSLLPRLRPRLSPSRPSLSRLPSRSPRRRLICLRRLPPPS